MDFDYKSPGWEAEGEENEDLKTTGFTAGYKPPASIFNWFWTRVSNCISELQSKITSLDTDKAAKNHRSSSSDYGLGTSNYYGHVKLSDSVTDSTHTASGGVAASPYAVKLAYDAAEAKAGTDVATTTTDGLMSASDKVALNNTAVSIQLTTEDLDDIITPGFYTGSGSNTCTNLPSAAAASSKAFGMTVTRAAGGDKFYVQTLYSPLLRNEYRRWCTSGTWGDWISIEGDGSRRLTSEDLDDVTAAGFYTAQGGNTCTNTPNLNGYAFGLEVVRLMGNTALYYVQTLYFASTSRTTVYRRWCVAGTWGDWTMLSFTDTTYSAATTTAAGLMSASDKAKLDGLTETGLAQYSTTAVQVGEWVDGSAIYRVAGTAAIPEAGLSDQNDDVDISGVNSLNTTALLRQDYYCDTLHFGSYSQFYNSCSSLGGLTVYYVIEYIDK